MVVILNFGSQTVHLIARRVRELGCYAEIVPYHVSLARLKKLSPQGLILSGGPATPYEKDAPLPSKKIFELGIPILGICYGHQLLTYMLGGKVTRKKVREYGKETLEVYERKSLFSGLSEKEQVWFSHQDYVIKPPPNFRITASTRTCKIAAMEDLKRKFFGVQFHPEVAHTLSGNKIFSNFLYKICQIKKTWTMETLSGKLLGEIKRQVGQNKIIIGVSGGVDSLVCATLLYQAIGKNLYCVFIDTGLLRQNEAKEVCQIFKTMELNLVLIDASEEFLTSLRGIIDPEEKRKIIGHTFIKIFERTARQLEKRVKIKFFAQGTIYPDRIESAQTSKQTVKIKSHHNLTLPEKLNFQVIEPLRDLYKDEVRKLGQKLGLPKKLLFRHPFPGPGLAIRVLGEVTEERLFLLRKVDEIFIQELRKNGQYDKIWQAFAALLPVKAVGVMGDQRTYDYIISLRAVTSRDGMTADWAKIPHEILEKISLRIVNEVPGINRVLYDISQKPPATIEYE